VNRSLFRGFWLWTNWKTSTKISRPKSSFVSITIYSSVITRSMRTWQRILVGSSSSKKGKDVEI